MRQFILRRLMILLPMLFILSVVSFFLIQLPPGDFLSSYVEQMKISGIQLEEVEIQQLTEDYGLDKPMHVQYVRWIGNIVTRGHFGQSFEYNRPVSDILKERLPLTMAIALLTMVFVWVTAIPIGVYSATHHYSMLDYASMFLGYVGLSVPNFLLALVLMWFLYAKTGFAITGLFSQEFILAPWSVAKVIDMIKHVWLPLIVIGTSGTAGIIRILRGTLLEELKKQYVVTARSKGVKEGKLLWKYPMRVAMSPLISTIGWLLPALISGEFLVAIVMNLQTVGPTLLRATMAQDMYLAGSILLLTSTLTIIGTFLSDLLLVWIDPRIRYEKRT